jgi:CheY-like chemotaxis protein
LGEPKAILDVALAAYEQYGNEDRLTLAASLLMDLGARALPALRVLARSNRAECTFFVPIIAGLSDVRPQDRLQALAHLARNPHSAVRQSLLEATQALPSPEAISLLHMLCQDSDEEIAEEARECLAHLEA